MVALMKGVLDKVCLANMDATTLRLHTDGVDAEDTYFFKGEIKKTRARGLPLQRVQSGIGKTTYLRLKFWCTTLA
jgi:hypothetical protein